MAIKRSDRVGEKFITRQGYSGEIVSYTNSYVSTVKLSDGTFIDNVAYERISDGCLKNPNHRNALGIGFQGQGKYTFTQYPEIEQKWRSMISRCYSEAVHKRQPAYIGCSVSEEWHNFQVFAEWYENNYNPEYMNSSWHLDKDIICKDCKTYSSENCAFIPREINNLFLKSAKVDNNCPRGVSKKKQGGKYHINLSLKVTKGFKGYFITPEEAFKVFKDMKEQHIKEVADKWKDLIDPRVYEALYNYRVEITD